MLRMISLLTVLTFSLATPVAAIAQDYGVQDRDNEAPPLNSGTQTPQNNESDGLPYAGRDLAYDYVTQEYYLYTERQPADRRASEQDGYRTGVLHTRNHGYHGRSRYYSGCGCMASTHYYAPRTYYASSYYQPSDYRRQ